MSFLQHRPALRCLDVHTSQTGRPPKPFRHNSKLIFQAGFFIVLALALHGLLFEPRPAVGTFVANLFQPRLQKEVPAIVWRPQAQDYVPPPWDTAVENDDGGPLEVILLNYDDDLAGALAPLYADLFAKLPLDVEFQVSFANESALERFRKRWVEPEGRRGRRFVLLNNHHPLTIWARDGQIALQNPEGTFRASLVPQPGGATDSLQLGDITVAFRRLESRLIQRTGLLPYFIEGGNLVANGSRAFVANQVIQDNASILPNKAVLAQELGRLFGRPLFLVHDRRGKVPWVHLDMYFTPLDEDTVLVASLKRGADILKSRAGYVPGPALEPDPTKERQLDEIAQQLTRAGYRVARVPALYHAREKWLLTYNNVLMERRDHRQIVYLPIYHLPALDDAATALYRSFGFQVKTVDVSGIFRLGGALRCVANVALRSATPHPFRNYLSSLLMPGADAAPPSSSFEAYGLPPSPRRALLLETANRPGPDQASSQPPTTSTLREPGA